MPKCHLIAIPNHPHRRSRGEAVFRDTLSEARIIFTSAHGPWLPRIVVNAIGIHDHQMGTAQRRRCRSRCPRDCYHTEHHGLAHADALHLHPRFNFAR